MFACFRMLIFSNGWSSIFSFLLDDLSVHSNSYFFNCKSTLFLTITIKEVTTKKVALSRMASVYQKTLQEVRIALLLTTIGEILPVSLLRYLLFQIMTPLRRKTIVRMTFLPSSPFLSLLLHLTLFSG